MLLESSEPIFIAFIKLEYFRKCKGTIDRYQDIPEKYFCTYEPDSYWISTSADRLFISHKWQTKEHPDPARKSLNDLLDFTKGFNDNTGIWWDFCCLPQRDPNNGFDDRTIDQKEFFKFQLSLIPYVILETRQLILWGEEGINSGWCCVENIVANILMQDLNKLINDGEPINASSAFLVANIENKILGKKRDVHQRISTSIVANNRYVEILKWFQSKTPQCEGWLNPGNYHLISKESITLMFEEFGLQFTNGADKDFVSELLFSIFTRLQEIPVNTTQLSGEHSYFLHWHHIRGRYGNCVMPKFDYWF